MVDARVDDVEPEGLEEQRADSVEEDEDGHEEHEHLCSLDIWLDLVIDFLRTFYRVSHLLLHLGMVWWYALHFLPHPLLLINPSAQVESGRHWNITTHKPSLSNPDAHADRTPCIVLGMVQEMVLEIVVEFNLWLKPYRVTIQVVSNLPLTPKQMLRFSISSSY